MGVGVGFQLLKPITHSCFLTKLLDNDFWAKQALVRAPGDSVTMGLHRSSSRIKWDHSWISETRHLA